LVIEKQKPLNFMQLEIRQTNMAKATAERVLEARYSYYRRCQLFRRNGEQCKAPAEKESAICHAHAAQQAMALRREIERGVVLAQAVAEMRSQGKPECEMADLLTDFKGIQVTLAVVSRALIDGRIDCKTAGRLLVGLQMASKALWMVHRKGREGRKENRVVPQICADERRLNVTHETPALKRRSLKDLYAAINGRSSTEVRTRLDLQVVLKSIVSMFPASHRECRDGPWEQARAA
jgi:hypothetical protein